VEKSYTHFRDSNLRTIVKGETFYIQEIGVMIVTSRLKKKT